MLKKGVPSEQQNVFANNPFDYGYAENWVPSLIVCENCCFAVSNNECF
jgi:hypothetical protein